MVCSKVDAHSNHAPAPSHPTRQQDYASNYEHMACPSALMQLEFLQRKTYTPKPRVQGKQISAVAPCSSAGWQSKKSLSALHVTIPNLSGFPLSPYQNLRQLMLVKACSQQRSASVCSWQWRDLPGLETLIIMRGTTPDQSRDLVLNQSSLKQLCVVSLVEMVPSKMELPPYAALHVSLSTDSSAHHRVWHMVLPQLHNLSFTLLYGTVSTKLPEILALPSNLSRVHVHMRCTG